MGSADLEAQIDKLVADTDSSLHRAKKQQRNRIIDYSDLGKTG